MTRPKQLSAAERQRLLDYIKELAIVSMFADDTLMDALVLKGGNALDLIYRISLRSSVDVDFSMRDDFPGGLNELRSRVSESLSQTYGSAGFHVFDLKVEEKPEVLSDELKSFWGGYSIEFKLIESSKLGEVGSDQDALRRAAINLGKGTRFLMDVSRFEHIENGRTQHELQGYVISVYSPAMIVAEKLRALCQQMEEYGPIVKRTRSGSSRARDFVDIHRVITTLNVDMTTPENLALITNVFGAKHVPLNFLGNLPKYKAFHAASFPAVKDTLRPGTDLRDFDFYFTFVMELIGKLESLWNK